MKVNGHRFARSFEDDEETVSDSDTEAEPALGGEPDYSFEGFSVEFLAKVQMLPVSTSTPAKGTR